MDSYFKKIKNLVFDEKYTLKNSDLIKIFDIDAKQAQCLLEQYVKSSNDLVVKYGLVGYQNNENDEIGMRRFMVVEKDDLDKEKSKYNKLISCSIRTIKDKNNLLDLEYPVETKLFFTKQDILDYQKKSFIKNENIELREAMVARYLKTLSLNPSELAKLNTKALNNAKDTKIINSNDSKKTDTISKPIDTSDSKSKNTNSLLAKNQPKKPNAFGNFKVIDKKEEIVIKNSNTLNSQTLSDTKNENKRQIHPDSDSEDEIFSKKENIKHKNKKPKRRIQAFQDSSEEEIDESKESFENMEIDFSKDFTENKKETGPCKLVEEEEEFVDEEGYIVNRKIKKVIKEDSLSNQNSPVVDKKNKEELINKNSNSSEKKSLPKKSTKVGKNQSCITSFFKPKN